MLLLTVLCGIIVYILWRLLFSKKKKNYDGGYKPGWFGKELTEEDPTVHPFKVSVPEEVLTDLRVRLERTRFEEPVEGAKFHYGFNSNFLRKLVHYWKTEYDWRKQEKFLNQYNHFKTKIEGIDVHFIHVKPNIPEGRKLQILPLMLIHGWPGSVVEFYKIIPLLTTPREDKDFVFEVVCPSIPGYGFSESPHRPGFNARAAARVFLTLMERLNHPKFYVQGGDWGSAISSLMARYYAPRILGLHVNMYFFKAKLWDTVKLFLIAFFPFLVTPQEYSSMYPLKKKIGGFLGECAYFHMQATKPDTLGSGMSDSPAGMAAYLLEKFGVATLSSEALGLEDGGLLRKFTMDELLTNVMLYWVNNNFTAAARFYKENLRDVLGMKHEKMPVTVPSAVALFPNEILTPPRTVMSGQMKQLVSYTLMPRGGHFAALEEPELLSDDLWKFVGIVQKLLKK